MCCYLPVFLFRFELFRSRRDLNEEKALKFPNIISKAFILYLTFESRDALKSFTLFITAKLSQN